MLAVAQLVQVGDAGEVDHRRWTAHQHLTIGSNKMAKRVYRILCNGDDPYMGSGHHLNCMCLVRQCMTPQCVGSSWPYVRSTSVCA